MKKTLLICGFIIAAASVSAAELEVKLGFDPYRDVTKDSAGNGPTGEYMGGSIGLELLFNENSPFRMGIGIEGKNQIEAKGGYDAHTMIPIYAVGKYDFSENWYGVGRLGYAIATNDADEISEATGGLYTGLGFGREFFNEKVNVELMYEYAMYDYRASSTFNRRNQDGEYHGIAIKFGYKFGGSTGEEAKPAPVVKPTPYVAPAPAPAPVVEETPEPPRDVDFRHTFKLNSAELNPEGIAKAKEMARRIKGFDGVVAIEGHTDTIGTTSYNQSLSEARAESVAVILRQELAGEDIEIETKGHGEHKPAHPNTTIENRQKNRRVEVIWLPEE